MREDFWWSPGSCGILKNSGERLEDLRRHSLEGGSMNNNLAGVCSSESGIQAKTL